MKRDAVLDESKKYRYTLLREWDTLKPRVAYIMLNPSTADAFIDDRTIIRCIEFAKEWGYGSIEVVNLFAYRVTQAKKLKEVSDPVGDKNDDYINLVASRSNLVIVAWGDNGTLLERDKEVLAKLAKVYCLGITKKGNPRHPLYVRSATKPVPYTA